MRDIKDEIEKKEKKNLSSETSCMLLSLNFQTEIFNYAISEVWVNLVQILQTTSSQLILVSSHEIVTTYKTND